MITLRKSALLAASGLLAQGCASQVVNPIGPEFRRAYDVERIEVRLTDPQGLPDRYDEAVATFYGDAMPESEKAGFDAFRAGSPEDEIAEQYLVYRISTILNERVPPTFRGERPARVTVDVTNTTFPNAATMMLVGEIKNITYDLRFVDGVDGDVLAETPKRMPVGGDRSAGAGGLLGMALRSGQHMNDLETLATNAAESASDFLIADTVSSVVVKRVTAYPDRIETEPPSASAMPTPIDEPMGAASEETTDAEVAPGV